ncbi:hypothetical protein ABL850_33250 [Variovorax paradoxus]|uniref:Uncharacterized protein n=1 Tax=Variovorax paradoxus (strain S110) TaxID=543728 RepID=C5D080_VARPS
MYCEVFRYLFEGQALSSKEAVKLTRRVGELVYMPRIHDPRPGRSLMIAMLLADDQQSYVIPLLNRACMLEVRGGFFIEGTEINPRGRALKNIQADIYPQRWFCRPVARPAPIDPKGARLEARRHGEMIAKALQRWPTRRAIPIRVEMPSALPNSAVFRPVGTDEASDVPPV